MPLGTPARRMPIPEEVGDFIGDLLGAAVSVSKSSPPDLTEEPEQWVSGVYVDDRGQPGGACVADIGLAASAGAALAMMPVAVVKEAIADGTLPAGLQENFYEVANIMTRLLNGPTLPHLRITELVPGIPDEVQHVLDNAVGRKNYAVTIIGYPGGRLILAAPGTS
jgi:hypothetical protein